MTSSLPDLRAAISHKPQPITKPQVSPAAIKPADEQGQDAGTAPAARRTKTPPRADQSRPRREYLNQITFTMAREVHRRGKERAAQRGETFALFILQAVNAHHGHILDGHDAPNEQAGGLFSVPQAARSKDSKVQTSMRITDGQLDAIGDLCKKTGMDRGEVFSAAVRLELARP